MTTDVGSSRTDVHLPVSGTRSTNGARSLSVPWGSRPDLEVVPPQSVRRSAHRFGIPALLLGTDLVAFATAVALTAAISIKTVGLLLLVVALFQTGGLYRRRLAFSVLDDAPAVLGRALAGGAAAMMLAGLDDGVAGTARLLTSAVFGVLALGGRMAAYGVIRLGRSRYHHFGRRTLLLGAGKVAGALAENLLAHREYGLKPVGMLDDDPLLGEQERVIPLLGGYEDLSQVLLEQSIDVVIVTYGSAREPSIVGMLRACDRLACEIYFVPRLFELHSVTKDTEVLWGVPLLRLRRAPFRTAAWAGKRISDVVLSVTALILLAPVLMLCAAVSRLETGRVLFRQTRVGLDGRPFTLLKFCSMRPEVQSEASTRWNIADDSRLRWGGRLMRRTSLDEIPQLWNVLRGDMSLVGPRPERPYFVDEFTRQFPFYTARHRLPVGLTGWAQIHGLRGDTSISERARFDNFYIENWSMWGDVKIVLRTFGQVLKAAGR